MSKQVGQWLLSRRSMVFGPPAFAGLVATGSASSLASQQLGPESYAKHLMAASGTPGLALAFGTQDMPAIALSLGVSNADTQSPVGPGTLFSAASISKMVFAYGVLLLIVTEN